MLAATKEVIDGQPLTDFRGAAQVWESNRRFQAKLGTRRRQALQIAAQIRHFVADNFDIDLPTRRRDYKSACRIYAATSPAWAELSAEYDDLARLYYTIHEYGLSVGKLFTNGEVYETFMQAHFYTRHRMDPVWNWRKSSIIRSRYARWLRQSRLWEQGMHPVHLTLTLPHAGGYYQGQRYYNKLLKEHFNAIRHNPIWKRMVYGGEYGIEIKRAATAENGLHIHLHCLLFLNPGVRVNDFRQWISDSWYRVTGAHQVWCETLYFFKRDAQGRYITTRKGVGLQTTEQPDGTYTTDYQSEVDVRQKFYVDQEARNIMANTAIPLEQRVDSVVQCYLHGILECIKYHFKMDDLRLTDGNWDLLLMNDLMQHTRNSRLYDRIGNFRRISELNFNQVSQAESDQTQPTDDEHPGAEPMARAALDVVDPFSLQWAADDPRQGYVTWRPEKQLRQPRSSGKWAYHLVNNYQTDIYEHIGIGMPLGQVMRQIITSRARSRLTKVNAA